MYDSAVRGILDSIKSDIATCHAFGRDSRNHRLLDHFVRSVLTVHMGVWNHVLENKVQSHPQVVRFSAFNCARSLDTVGREFI